MSIQEMLKNKSWLPLSLELKSSGYDWFMTYVDLLPKIKLMVCQGLKWLKLGSSWDSVSSIPTVSQLGMN